MENDQFFQILRTILDTVQAAQKTILALQEQVGTLQQEWSEIRNQILHMKADQESQSLKTKILNNRVTNYLENNGRN